MHELPTAKHFASKLRIVDFFPGQKKSFMGVHWIESTLVSPAEFDAIGQAYRQVRDQWVQVKSSIYALVYAEAKPIAALYEWFKCPGQPFFILAMPNGQLDIVDTNSPDSLCLPYEKRHRDYVGRFEDDGRVLLAQGRILSHDVYKGLAEKPVKKVHIKDEAENKEYDGQRETLWVDLLFGDQAVSLKDPALILDATNPQRMKLRDALMPAATATVATPS